MDFCRGLECNDMLTGTADAMTKRQFVRCQELDADTTSQLFYSTSRGFVLGKEFQDRCSVLAWKCSRIFTGAAHPNDKCRRSSTVTVRIVFYILRRRVKASTSQQSFTHFLSARSMDVFTTSRARQRARNTFKNRN